MRHAVFGRKLGRDINARKSLLANLASSIFINGFIVTTEAKAKFARPHVEKLITQAKHAKHLDNQRRLAALLTDAAFKKLRIEIAPGFGQRNGGYTRIIKLKSRLGDAASLARIELLKPEGPKRSRKMDKPKAVEPKKASLDKHAVGGTK